jgi:uncharacterized protein with HEPN domain
MNDKDEAYTKDILAMITEIENTVKGLTYEDFMEDRTAFRAVERNFEIIGEAVKRLSPEFTKTYPEVAWQEIAGFRDILIHDYAAVNVATVWDTLQQDIPKLKTVLQKTITE